MDEAWCHLGVEKFEFLLDSEKGLGGASVGDWKLVEHNQNGSILWWENTLRPRLCNFRESLDSCFVEICRGRALQICMDS